MSVNSFVSKCNCEHEGQDSMYGKGNRVFNNGLKSAKCTVCGATREVKRENQFAAAMPISTKE